MPRPQSVGIWLAVVLVSSGLPARAQPEPLLRNGGFEEARVVEGPASGDQGFGLWTLGENKLAPAGWSLNSAYPGSVEVVTGGAPEGERFLRIRANGQRGMAHVYQPCPGLAAGKAYMITARVRGGPVTFGSYEYLADGAIKVPEVLGPVPASEDWREVSGYYYPRGEGFQSASLAIIVPAGAVADVDNLRLEEAPEMAIPDDLQPVVLESDLVRVTLSPTGLLEEFTCKATGVNYAAVAPTTALLGLKWAGSEVPVHFLRQRGEIIEAQFRDPRLKASFRFERHPAYFTLELVSLSVEDADSVQLCRFGLDIAKSVGTLINAAWEDDFAACVLACNDRTHSFGASGSRADLTARCYREFGMVGAKVAVIGVPLDPPGSTDRLLDVIERVELDQGLPHPTMKGVWIKRAPERFASYLMAGGASEANLDEVVEFARGGFGCVELLNWWHSTPTYAPHPALFPNGLAGMKACADKIHAAGMEVGLHTMQAMVGWGGVGMRDPYVSPRADPRLLRDHQATLAGDLAAGDTEIAVGEDVSDWPERGDLFLDGELVRYSGRAATSFSGCTRGLHGTEARSHAAGTPVGLMVNCFSMWDHVIYAPDVNSTMVDEACANIAGVFNAVGADMAYFDGGEEIAVQPPHWHNQGKVALGVSDRLDKAIVLEGNAIYTHLAWHVITRGSPSFDPIYYGRRDYTLRHKGQNPAGWARNLLTGDVGWFNPHVHSGSTYAVTPDEVMLLCLKALGGKAPISFQVNCDNLYANRRMPEMLDIIRTCDRLKRQQYFSDEVCARLAEPFAEHTLDRSPEGQWQVRPMKYGPERLLVAGAHGTGEFGFDNPHGAQRPWVRLRARSRLASFGSADDLVLADYAEGVPFRADGTASPDLTQQVAPSAETAPDGARAFVFSAANKAAGRSGWCRLSLPLDPPLDLSRHRCLGLWVRGEGKGGILNVQLAQGHGFRDHYIPLDYTGWRYHVLTTAEAERYYDYQWPHDWISIMYWAFRYTAVKGLNLYYNALPAGAEVSCLVSRIEALREYDVPMEAPSLEVGSRRVVFPVSLRPDEYVELGWDGKCRHFDPDGGLLADVTPQGQVRLRDGANAVRFACASGEDRSPRAEVTLAVRATPLENRRATAAGPDADEAPADDALYLVPTSRRGFRLVQGLYERVGREPARAIAAFDGAANVWTVENAAGTPRGAALVLDYTEASTAAIPDDARATVIEAFDDLRAYEMSPDNRYEKYVVGGGKELPDSGPVRAGVSQSLEPSEGSPVARAPCVRYAATNRGAAGGWCAKGRRFDPPLDLSAHEVLGLWVHGDGGGELLKVQFRDVGGAWCDWPIRVDFAGWRREAYRLDGEPGFDWSKVEYVIFYYNDLPAARSVAVKLSNLVAAAQVGPAPALVGPAIVVNGETVSLADRLQPAEALTLDDRGRVTHWQPGMKRSRELPGRRPPLVLQPGANRFELRHGGASQAAPAGVSARVVPL